MPESDDSVGQIRRDFSEFKERDFSRLTDRVGNLETAQEACMEMQTERHEGTKKAIAGVSNKLTALILMGAATILGALLTLIISLLTK